MLDCSLEAVNKGLEAIKLFNKVLNEHPELKPYVYDIQVHCGDDYGDDASECHLVGVWSYFDDESFEFKVK